MKLIQLLLLSTFSLLYSTISNATEYSSATEIRAVWLTTNWKLDWPQKGKTVQEQKQELIDILDQLAEYNINLILFQVRAQGRAFYNSGIMEKSIYYNSKDNFDPLAFAIEECHKRQMECHAWMTTFPVEKINMKNKKMPGYFKKVNGYWYLDPASPETKNILKSIVSELVDNYNIDGIHLDYIRYPDKKNWLDDSDTYRKYGRNIPKDEWRRENINLIVREIYDLVKSKKDWVQVSSSPIGKFKRIHENDTWTSFDDVSQDPISWLASNKQDIIFPMMYYEVDDFKRHYDYWVQQAKDRYVVPGIGLYKINEEASPILEKDIVEELLYLKKKQSKGVAFFRADQVISDKTNIKETLEHLYTYPAKLPPLFWLDDSKNSNTPALEGTINKNGNLLLSWKENKRIMDNTEFTYNIYTSHNKIRDTEYAEKLLIANFRGNQLEIDYDKGEYGMYYYVTSSNRYHTESSPSESVYFYHSNTLYK